MNKNENSTSSTPTISNFRILELFSGIGGLNWALKLAAIPCDIVAAMEINPTVLETYKHNFKCTNVLTKNLEGITAEEINELNIDAIVMSPPCQPFCRTGNRLDVQDTRTGPLSHLTEILTGVNFKYIFVENVQGFEVSTARDNLLQVLTNLKFRWQEFMLTPRTLGIPNSRLRYYLIGKHESLQWSFDLQPDQFLSEIPNWNNLKDMPFRTLQLNQENINKTRRLQWQQRLIAEGHVDNVPAAFCVGDIMEWNLTDEGLKKLQISKSVMDKYYQAMDIVKPLSISTCCFTKGYSHFIKGTGSILNMSYKNNISGEESSENPDTTKSLRYFSPKEVSRLMCYPEEFELPPHLSFNQQYRSLGNSVNVYVVAILFTLLF